MNRASFALQTRIRGQDDGYRFAPPILPASHHLPRRSRRRVTRVRRPGRFDQQQKSVEDEIEQQACKFEHILSPEVTDKICSFLGHPECCPHGSPIPSGECCEKAGKVGHRVFERGPAVGA